MIKVPETKETKNQDTKTQETKPQETRIPDMSRLENKPLDMRVSSLPNTARSVPSNWNIEDAEDMNIIARNNITGDVFTGKPKEFSSYLRGL